MFNTSALAVEVVNVDVKRKPYDEAWKSQETMIVSEAESVSSGEFNRYER